MFIQADNVEECKRWLEVIVGGMAQWNLPDVDHFVQREEPLATDKE